MSIYKTEKNVLIALKFNTEKAYFNEEGNEQIHIIKKIYGTWKRAHNQNN